MNISVFLKRLLHRDEQSSLVLFHRESIIHHAQVWYIWVWHLNFLFSLPSSLNMSKIPVHPQLKLPFYSCLTLHNVEHCILPKPQHDLAHIDEGWVHVHRAIRQSTQVRRMWKKTQTIKVYEREEREKKRFKNIPNVRSNYFNISLVGLIWI